ncbi:unnamed protein product [Phaedon cochleariae]|uniref:Poly [ADP-ribose] polymerase n=1 Tax=Phaedon cochleariae TaxID=80249 RepID=A0A9P0DQN8_PHACE|nr:unnamed protein product [Phaedon cochleariae]
MDTVIEDLSQISLNDEEKKLEELAPIEIKKDPTFVRDLFRHSRMYSTWINVDYNLPYTLIAPGGKIYREIETKFKNDWLFHDSSAELHKIVRIQNPFLCLQYELKLKQKKELHGSVQENQLYHGTKGYNVDSICQGNFDWRRLGASGYRSSKFGQGVSFSPHSSYASDYPRKYFEHPRVMILAREMEISRCWGHDGMVIPPLPHDTSGDLSSNNNVVVKYFDNEFYPEFIIYYYYNK